MVISASSYLAKVTDVSQSDRGMIIYRVHQASEQRATPASFSIFFRIKKNKNFAWTAPFWRCFGCMFLYHAIEKVKTSEPGTLGIVTGHNSCQTEGMSASGPKLGETSMYALSSPPVSPTTERWSVGGLVHQSPDILPRYFLSPNILMRLVWVTTWPCLPITLWRRFIGICMAILLLLLLLIVFVTRRNICRLSRPLRNAAAIRLY